jgi:hypothetical protein
MAILGAQSRFGIDDHAQTGSLSATGVTQLLCSSQNPAQFGMARLQDAAGFFRVQAATAQDASGHGKNGF